MLKNLFIENVALISKLNISFEKGLSVLSGETGAGKSIIIDALAFVLGSRADKSLIKSGEERAFVEAVFDIEAHSRAAEALEAAGFQAESECVLSRSLTNGGKNEIRLNGRVTALAVLKQVSALLVDISGQNEQTYLLKNDNHISILDGFLSDESLLEKVRKGYQDLKKIDKELEKYGGSDSERERALDILRFQIDEIEGADLSVSEEDELLAFRKKALNAEKVSSALASAVNSLGESESCGIVSVSHALNSLTVISGLDNEYELLRQRLESSKIEIQDILDSLSASLNNFDFNPKEIDRVEVRLDKIKSLKRKYGGTVEKALEFLEKSKAAYSELFNADETIAALKAQKSKAFDELYNLCSDLTAFRKNAALKLEAAITRELGELGMAGAAFAVQFSDIPPRDAVEEKINANGWDKPEFLFSANKGEPVKPLSKIISGGEMSRFMLAVKNITAKIEEVPTMIFDEIDSGVSGNMASVVAQKLARISKDYQTVVITHLPQIACMADTNYLVDKFVENGKTKTTVRQLDADGKISEVQRLIGGADAGRFGGLHAKDMIMSADNFKNKL